MPIPGNTPQVREPYPDSWIAVGPVLSADLDLPGREPHPAGSVRDLDGDGA